MENDIGDGVRNGTANRLGQMQVPIWDGTAESLDQHEEDENPGEEVQQVNQQLQLERLLRPTAEGFMVGNEFAKPRNACREKRENLPTTYQQCNALHLPIMKKSLRTIKKFPLVSVLITFAAFLQCSTRK